jgi:hypothetical protein
MCSTRYRTALSHIFPLPHSNIKYRVGTNRLLALVSTFYQPMHIARKIDRVWLISARTLIFSGIFHLFLFAHSIKPTQSHSTHHRRRHRRCPALAGDGARRVRFLRPHQRATRARPAAASRLLSPDVPLHAAAASGLCVQGSDRKK